MVEPTRLAATHLADAYTQVVPLRARSPQSLPDVQRQAQALAIRRGRRS